MRILVTGGTGFTGGALVARLLMEGHAGLPSTTMSATTLYQPLYIDNLVDAFLLCIYP